MASYFVYSLIDPRNKEIRYIGKTVVSLSTRLSQHIYAAKNNKWKSHVNNWIVSVLNSGNNPVVNVLSVVSDKYVLAKEEIRLIAYYLKRGARLTNLTNGGDGAPGRKLSDSSKEKLRKANTGKIGYWTGKKRDPETGKKISQANIGKKAWNKGIPLSEDCKKKLRKAMIGRKPSQETRRKLEKIWESRRGKKIPIEVCQKISNALKGKPGRKQSDEVRKKIAKGMRKYRAKLATMQEGVTTIPKGSRDKCLEAQCAP